MEKTMQDLSKNVKLEMQWDEQQLIHNIYVEGELRLRMVIDHNDYPMGGLYYFEYYKDEDGDHEDRISEMEYRWKLTGYVKKDERKEQRK